MKTTKEEWEKIFPKDSEKSTEIIKSKNGKTVYKYKPKEEDNSSDK